MLAIAVLGCGGGSSAKMVTAADVQNIPPGNRTGTALSGDCVVTSTSVEDCRCRTGTCPIVSAPSGGTLVVFEQDGKLQITGASGELDTGGVNADNTFSVGGSSLVPYGQGTIDELVSGSFDVSNGVPTGMHVVDDETVTATSTGSSYDCDVLVDSVCSYSSMRQLPSAYLLEITPGSCMLANAQPQSIPASTVSYSIDDSSHTDQIQVAVVDGADGCGATGTGVYIQATSTTGGFTYSGPVPAGSYDLAITCKNAVGNCIIRMVSWTADAD